MMGFEVSDMAKRVRTELVHTAVVVGRGAPKEDAIVAALQQQTPEDRAAAFACANRHADLVCEGFSRVPSGEKIEDTNGLWAVRVNVVSYISKGKPWGYAPSGAPSCEDMRARLAPDANILFMSVGASMRRINADGTIGAAVSGR